MADPGVLRGPDPGERRLGDGLNGAVRSWGNWALAGSINALEVKGGTRHTTEGLGAVGGGLRRLGVVSGGNDTKWVGS